MEISEKELEDIVFNSSAKILSARGLPMRGLKFRQQRIGEYGISDIITFERNFNTTFSEHENVITIWELNKNDINSNTLCQAFRYLSGIKRYSEENDNRLANFIYGCSLRVALLGTSICDGDFRYLCGKIDNVDFYTCHYDINGMTFKSHDGYVLINENF